MKNVSEWGRFFICPTPIGNLGDITYRTVLVLKQVDLIACEDTRVSRKLLQRYSIQKPLFPYHAHNYQTAIQKILTHLRSGKSIALITDAGMQEFKIQEWRILTNWFKTIFILKCYQVPQQYCQQ